jgi:flavin-dependent dehydrogenase
VANVGVALKPGSHARASLRRLLTTLSIGEDAILRHTGGLVPCGGPLGRTWQDNIVLVGDAAGQTHPITGAGVANACLCGQMAGRAAARAALQDDPRLLREYEREWRDFLGAVLDHATARRRLLDAHWSRDAWELGQVLRQTWVAFSGYGRRT